MLHRDDIKEEERADFLNRIEVEITRINVIIRQLLDFSRPATGRPEPAPVHDIIRRTVDILKPQPMMEDIQVRFHLNAAHDRVYADPQQLQQVFLNIIMNAADAHAGEPRGEGTREEKTIQVETGDRGNRIEMRFADNGPGIAPGELEHIFDPFYTTKDPGQGTGLGLSVSYQIVDTLGGALRAESTLGKGTTIIIDLPLFRTEGDR